MHGNHVRICWLFIVLDFDFDGNTFHLSSFQNYMDLTSFIFTH